MHYWSVWHEKKPFEAYYSIKPRFVSEFGYQSLPSMSEIKTFADKEDLNITSPIMEFHQRSPGGNPIIFENFSRYFRVPSTFESMVYLSQVQQAIAIQTAVQYWRSLRPICMGATVWQINDVWPIASWSSIDYSGKWKLLHYNEKKFFSPVFLSAFVKDSLFQAYVLNDTRKELNVKITISTLNFKGKKVKDDVEIIQTIAPDSSTLVYELPIEKPISDSFIHATMEYGESKTETTVFTSFQKKCYLEDPEIKYQISEVTRNPGSYRIKLTAKKPAFYVSLDQQGIPGIFSDNMFTLLPNET
jgi:beta-mannosidase